MLNHKHCSLFCNRYKSVLLFIFLLLSLIPKLSKAADNNLQRQARTFINLLDYVSQDYFKAVSNGRIVNAKEYTEMIDFTGEAISLFDSLKISVQIQNREIITSQLSTLLISIKQKKDKNVIASSAQQIKKQILLLNIIDIYPEQYPDIKEGKKLFLSNCQSCHGKNGEGDGKLSASLTPRPANFLDDSFMQFVSPLQVFNTSRLGVQGTAMRPFDELSDKELWQIAFFIKSLRFEKKYAANTDLLERIYKNVQPAISLSDIAHLSDKELEEKLSDSIKEKTIAAIRVYHPDKIESNSLDLSIAYLNEALKFYENHNVTLAEEKALYAYLDGIEPVEQQLTAIDAAIVPELESKMNSVRSAIKEGSPSNEVAQKINESKASIRKASQLLDEQTYSFWFSFLIAASILLREGLEAVLIIITILSLLQSLNAQKAVRWVHGGWLTAVAIGVASWFFTDWLISFGSQNREIIEGIGAIIAVVILMYVGFWLHNKTEAKKWEQFIHMRITALLDEGKMFGLAFISFIVVFREAFESILFLSSMQLQVDDSSRSGIWIGAVSAIITVILLAHLLLRFAAKIPVRKLFQYSAIIIMILAVVLAGQGVHAFQESGWLSVTSIPINFHLGILGIFPTAQTYIAQFVAIIVIVIIWSRRKKSIAVEGKSNFK